MKVSYQKPFVTCLVDLLPIIPKMTISWNKIKDIPDGHKKLELSIIEQKKLKY